MWHPRNEMQAQERYCELLHGAERQRLGAEDQGS
jgi:hypothetical protein